MVKLLPIEGYEDYMVSSCGQVVSLKGSEMTVLVGSANQKGYRSVALHKDGVPKRCLVHRLVAEIYLPHPNSDNLTVDHIDRDKSNNAASNLRWMTIEENRRRESKKQLPIGVAATGYGTYFGRRSIGGVYYYSPVFKTVEEAGQWYDGLLTKNLKKERSCIIGKKSSRQGADSFQ